MVLTSLTERLAQIFLAPSAILDYSLQEEALKRCLSTVIVCRYDEVIDQVIDVLELLPYFFLAPSIYHGHLQGDWAESLPEAYEEIRVILDEQWDELYDELHGEKMESQ